MAVNIEQTDIDVEDWIDGVSYTQARVTIHRNPALYAEYEPLLARIAEAEAEVAEHARPRDEDDDEGSLADAGNASGEAALGDHADSDAKAAQERLDALYAEAKALVQRYDADVEIWRLRALEPEEAQEIVQRHPRPAKPAPPAKNASKATREKHQERLTQWVTDVAEIQGQINLEMVAAAVMGVTVHGEEKPAPSLDGIHRVAKRPHGRRHVTELVQALTAITTQEVEISAPHRAGA